MIAHDSAADCTSDDPWPLQRYVWYTRPHWDHNDITYTYMHDIANMPRVHAMSWSCLHAWEEQLTVEIFQNVTSTTYWSDAASTRDHNITEDRLVEQIKFLVDNIYIQVGNRIFRQTIGIPMGTDCAPLLANLSFFTTNTNSWKTNLNKITG